MNQFVKNTGPFYHSNTGSMIIGLIMAITIIGIISAGTLYLRTSSTQTGLFPNAYSSAYYLAESGVRYARLNVKDDITFPIATQFNLSNGDAFVIRTMDDPEDSSRIIIYSTGIVKPGTWFESKCDLISNSSKSGSVKGVTDVGLIVLDDKDKPVLDPRLTVTGGDEDKIVKFKSVSGINVLSLISQTGTIKKTFQAILLSLAWWSVTPENPDFDQAWSNNEQLLSYEVQVKVNIETLGNLGGHYLHGISFRLSPQNPDWANSSTIRSYGISYFRSVDSNWPFDVGLDNSFNAIMSDPDPYIVLWEKTGSSNALSLIDYRKLTSGDGVLDGSNLKEWSTILLKVEEKPAGPFSTENHISGFIQGSDTMPLGTINWNHNAYNEVVWHTNSSQPIIDNSLTSQSFDTLKPDEIGIHAFYDSSAANKQLFSDFSLKVEAITDPDPDYQW